MRVASILEDVDSAAAWIASALNASGYVADFSGPSLWEVDRFFDDHSAGGAAKRGGLLATDTGSRLFALGSYVGEVVRRSVGGTWVGDEDDAQAEVNVALALPDGSSIWPVQRVMKRFANGPEDGLAAYGAALGVSVGPRPEPPKRRGLFGGGRGRH